MRPAAAILAGACVLHVAGLVDDRRALPPVPKLAVQVAVAVCVSWLGDIRALTLLDAHVGGPWLSVLLTSTFIVALVNAVNFLDNMDGLSGGVSAIAAAALCVAACVARQWATAGVLSLLCGGLLGFLAFNFPWRAGQRARIFMGDGGSLPVGFLLATLAVRITFTAPEASHDFHSASSEPPGPAKAAHSEASNCLGSSSHPFLRPASTRSLRT